MKMQLLLEFILLMSFSSPMWCWANRTKRTTLMADHNTQQIDINYIRNRYPELEKLIPMLCKQYNSRMPWFRHRQEQMFAFNEQMMPHPFISPFDNNQQFDIFNDGLIPSHRNQFPPIPGRGQNFPRNDGISMNQQYINNIQNDYPNQIPRPPVRQQGYNQYDPYSRYDTRSNNYQQYSDIDSNTNKNINIEVNADSTQNNAPINNMENRSGMRQRHDVGSPYDQTNNNDLLSMYPTAPNYGSVQNAGYPSVYPRSTNYLGRNSLPTDLVYSPSEHNPVFGSIYEGPAPTYTIDPRIFSQLDNYIQSKIDASNKEKNDEKMSPSNASPNNHTAST